jgi:N-methylhydantoinase A
VALGVTPKPPLPAIAPGTAAEARRGLRRVWIAEEAAFADVPVYDGERLGRGARLDGPAMVELATTTVVVPPAFGLETDRHGSFLMERR